MTQHAAADDDCEETDNVIDEVMNSLTALLPWWSTLSVRIDSYIQTYTPIDDVMFELTNYALCSW